MKKFFSNLYRKIATVLAFSMLATVAHAGAYNCNAALSGVGVYSDGKVFIHQGYAWVYVCNMTTQAASRCRRMRARRRTRRCAGTGDRRGCRHLLQQRRHVRDAVGLDRLQRRLRRRRSELMRGPRSI